MNLSWYAYLPIVAGLIGGLIGGYYHKQYQKSHNQIQKNRKKA